MLTRGKQAGKGCQNEKGRYGPTNQAVPPGVEKK